MRRLLPFIFFFVFLFFLPACAGTEHPLATPNGIADPSPTLSSQTPDTPRQGSCVPSARRREEARVTSVTDGDSIEVEMNGAAFRVRFIGIDASEMGREPFAEDARDANRTLLEGKRLILVRDLSEADPYGRLLRYVFADGVFVNRELVRMGMAQSRTYAPDLACAEELEAAQAEAQREQLGLWGISPLAGVQTSIPIDCGLSGQSCTPPSPECAIKGNISLSGEKIYHVPSGKFYAKTVVEPEKGERWFCGEEEAVAAGWRRSKQ